jgi:hypothetical protein
VSADRPRRRSSSAKPTRIALKNADLRVRFFVQRDGSGAMESIHDSGRHASEVSVADSLSWATTGTDADVTMLVGIDHVEAEVPLSLTVTVDELLHALGVSPPTTCTLTFVWARQHERKHAGSVLLRVRPAGSLQ